MCIAKLPEKPMMSLQNCHGDCLGTFWLLKHEKNRMGCDCSLYLLVMGIA